MKKLLESWNRFLNESYEDLSVTLQKLAGKSRMFGMGTLSVDKDMRAFKITWDGNMGSTIERSVDPELVARNIPTVAELKEMYPDFIEEGTPEYQWQIVFKLS